MKKLIIIQVLAILFLIGGIFFSSGCWRGCNGDLVRGFPDKWTEAKIPLVEGEVSRCKKKPERKIILPKVNSINNKTSDYSTLEAEFYASLIYENTSVPDLHKKYEQKYISEGWKFETTWKEKLAYVKASKDEIEANFSFSGTCGIPNCAGVSFYNVTRNDVPF